jgi:hypothetical protein
MIYIYPLRLVFSALFSWISGNYFPSEFVIQSVSELSSLFIYYGFGFAAIAILLSLLFYRGYKLRDSLDLNAVEILMTKYDMTSWGIMALTALLSAMFAIVAPLKLAVFAGFLYTTLPFTMPTISIYFSRRIDALLKNEGDDVS